ncbi:MAG: type II restriction endonuclease [Candidatus Poribacteria bacterium]|nr:type II restriction endonuclease [Candidatus Poribacteria bacterium]
MAWLFGITDTEPDLFVSKEIADRADADFDFPTRLILDELGIEYEDPHANELDSIIERFGYEFLTTREFSDCARLTFPSVSARDALMAWVDHEYAMFRRLEVRIMGPQLLGGWTAEDGSADVDAFLSYSLSVQNRRKSRMGKALEHPLEAVFDTWEICCDKQVKTETGKTADFIFPGEQQYFDKLFPVRLLTMLAAKSSCKERWSQILSEANRIEHKHLVTLEPGISVDGTDSMREARVQLVVPTRIQKSYKPEQQNWLMSVREFVDMVLQCQTAGGIHF